MISDWELAYKSEAVYVMHKARSMLASTNACILSWEDDVCEQ